MPDAEILAKFKNEATRHEAFSLLVKTYQQRLYWHIRRIVIDHDDANDIVQDVFVKVWKNLSSFREDSKIYTWLYRIATNECITFLNRRKMKMAISLDDNYVQLSEKLEQDIYFDGNKLERKLQQALLTLPNKQRVVFNMKYFEEMKYEEMAKILGTSVGALKASYHHAVKKIENYFKED